MPMLNCKCFSVCLSVCVCVKTLTHSIHFINILHLICNTHTCRGAYVRRNTKKLNALHRTYARALLHTKNALKVCTRILGLPTLNNRHYMCMNFILINASEYSNKCACMQIQAFVCSSRRQHGTNRKCSFTSNRVHALGATVLCNDRTMGENDGSTNKTKNNRNQGTKNCSIFIYIK